MNTSSTQPVPNASTHTPPAVVLLSGGLDSATTLAIARAQGFACHALSFAYGQRHKVELDAARRIGAAMGVATHQWVTIDRSAFAGLGGSALTDTTMAVPKDRSDADMSGEIPVTYVPARNTIFLSYALGLAEVLGSGDIFLGINAVDYSGYPDCRPQFVTAFEALANLATKAGVQGKPLRVHAPLIHLTKVEIIQRGLDLGVDYGLTHSCYDPDPTTGRPCGHCDSCLLRIKAFAQLGMNDPAL